MGTLFNQRERAAWKSGNYLTELRWELESEMKEMDKNWSVDQKLKMLELMLIKEKNNMYEQNGDVHDEQMAGFGELIKQSVRIFADMAYNQ